MFIPFVVSQLQSCDTESVVRDSYQADSVKEGTRKKKEKVADNTKLPRDWLSFIKDPPRSVPFSTFKCPKDEGMYITQGENVLPNIPLKAMEKCNHEEANTRILVYIKDAISKGAKNAKVLTADTDVIVFLVGHFHELKPLYLLVWVAFGMENNLRDYSVNTLHVCDHIGEQKSKGLPIFHAFTGCDTKSSFHGKGDGLRGIACLI